MNLSVPSGPIRVKVICRASFKKVESLGGNQYKVRTPAVPFKGKANKEAVRILADHFKIRKSQVKIIKGLKKRDKIVLLK